MRFPSKVALLLPLSFAVSGCDPEGVTRVKQPGQFSSVISSSPVSRNVTPYDDVLACFGERLSHKPLSIAVGDVRDYTGRAQAESGFAITQGGALMAYSALGKMMPGVRIHERFDTRIADAELAYIKDRKLGDGQKYEVPDTETGEPVEVPWKPYYGGSVLQSEYYIVGGITELNYNIQSGGAEFQIDQVGPGARRYVANVAVDLRIVGSQSLRVYKTASVQKQVIGFETKFEVFRFFDNDLFDINIGEKSQEPLHLAVRVAIEEAVLQLVSSISHEDSSECRQIARTKNDSAG